VDDDAEVAVGVGLPVAPDGAHDIEGVDLGPDLPGAGVGLALDDAGEADALDAHLVALGGGEVDDASAADLPVGLGPDGRTALLDERLAVLVLELGDGMGDRAGEAPGAAERGGEADALEGKVGVEPAARGELLEEVAPGHLRPPSR